MPSLKELALTQERLKHLLHYNPDTGVFTWVQRASKSVRVGNSAGSKNKSGYIDIRIDKSLHKAHRLAWLYIYGVWPNGKIDHINNVKTDNRICNLREASNNENGWNVGKPSTNTSGVKGVSWDAEKNKWKAHCRVFGEKYTVGRSSSKEDAERAVAEFRNKHHGEFCNHG